MSFSDIILVWLTIVCILYMITFIVDNEGVKNA